MECLKGGRSSPKHRRGCKARAGHDPVQGIKVRYSNRVKFPAIQNYFRKILNSEEIVEYIHANLAINSKISNQFGSFHFAYSTLNDLKIIH